MKKNILKLLLILLSMCFIFPLSSFGKLIVTEGKFDTAPILNGKGRIILKVIETSGDDMPMSSDGSQESVMFNMQLHNIIVDDSMMNHNAPDGADVSGDGTMFEYFIANMTEDNTSINMQRSEDIGAFEIVSLELDVNVLEGTDDSELNKGFSITVEGDDTNKYFDGAISSYTSAIRSTMDITSPNHKSEHTIEELENMSVSGTANNVNANNSISLFINNVLLNENVSIDSDGSWSLDDIDLTSFTDFTDANPREFSQYRYIAIEQNGSNANEYNHFVEIRVLNHDDSIIPYNNEDISVMNLDASGASTGNEVVEFRGDLDLIHDGDTRWAMYTEPVSGRYIRLTIDFGELKDIASVHMWRYYAGYRRYKQSVVKVSKDGVNWVIISDGIEYTEGSGGKEFIVPPVNQISTYNIKATIDLGNIIIENTVSVREENTNESIEILEPMNNDILNINNISQVATMWKVKNHYIGSSAELKNDILNSAITMNFDDNDLIETQTDELNLSIEDNRYQYIAIEQNGNSINSGNHIIELDVYDNNDEEISYLDENIKGYMLNSNGEVTDDTSFSNKHRMNDNNFTNNGFTTIAIRNDNNYTRIVIDLEEQKDIGHVKLWRYFHPNAEGKLRTYYNSAVKVSKDGTNWITLSNGIDYIETDKGKTFYTSYVPKRNIVATLYDENNDTLDTYEVELIVNYGNSNLLDTNITYNYDDIDFASEENIYLGTIENSNEVTPYEFEFVIDDNNESRFFVIENDGSIYYKAGSSVSSDLILSNYIYSLKVRVKALGNGSWSRSRNVNLTFISEFEISDITITPTTYNADNRDGIVQFEFSGALDTNYGLNEFNVMAENGVLDNFVASDNRRIWTADFTADTNIERDITNIIKLVEDNLSSIKNDSLESITRTNANLNSNSYTIDTQRPFLSSITEIVNNGTSGGSNSSYIFAFNGTLDSENTLQQRHISADNAQVNQLAVYSTNGRWRVDIILNNGVYGPNSEIKLTNAAYNEIKDISGNTLLNKGVKFSYDVGDMDQSSLFLETITGTGVGNGVLNTNDNDWNSVSYIFSEPISSSISNNAMLELLQDDVQFGELSNVRVSDNRENWTVRYVADSGIERWGIRLSISSNSWEDIKNNDGHPMRSTDLSSSSFRIDTIKPSLIEITMGQLVFPETGDTSTEVQFVFSEQLSSNDGLELADIDYDQSVGTLSNLRRASWNENVWIADYDSTITSDNHEKYFIKLKSTSSNNIKDLYGNFLEYDSSIRSPEYGTLIIPRLEEIKLSNKLITRSNSSTTATFRFNRPIDTFPRDAVDTGNRFLGATNNPVATSDRSVWTMVYNISDTNLQGQEPLENIFMGIEPDKIISADGVTLTNTSPTKTTSDSYSIAKYLYIDGTTDQHYTVAKMGEQEFIVESIYAFRHFSDTRQYERADGSTIRGPSTSTNIPRWTSETTDSSLHQGLNYILPWNDAANRLSFRDEEIWKTKGLLYQGRAARNRMDLGFTGVNLRGQCPFGYHMIRYKDVHKLFKFLGGYYGNTNNYRYDKLMASPLSSWLDDMQYIRWPHGDMVEGKIIRLADVVEIRDYNGDFYLPASSLTLNLETTTKSGEEMLGVDQIRLYDGPMANTYEEFEGYFPDDEYGYKREHDYPFGTQNVTDIWSTHRADLYNIREFAERDDFINSVDNNLIDPYTVSIGYYSHAMPLKCVKD